MYSLVYVHLDNFKCFEYTKKNYHTYMHIYSYIYIHAFWEGERQCERERAGHFPVPVHFEWKWFKFPLASCNLGKHFERMYFFLKSNCENILSHVQPNYYF